MYFTYGAAELNYLRKKDKRLGGVIDRVGPIRREVDPDLFSSVVHHIIGQQISTKAQATIWQRMRDALGQVNAETVLAAGVPRLQALGMTFSTAGLDSNGRSTSLIPGASVSISRISSPMAICTKANCGQ